MNQIIFPFYLLSIIQVIKYTYIIHTVLSLVYSSNVPKVDTTNPENHISDQDPNILNLMVSHYDCAKQNNLRQFSLLNVEPCKQAPSDIQHAKTQATVYVRAKAKRIKAFKCEAYIKTEKVWCSQTFTSSRRYDRLQWGQNTLELPKILDPIECKNMIRYLNATDSEELNNYNIQSSFSLFGDSNYQNTIERIQTPFRVTKLNTWHIGTFVFDENYPDWIVNVTQNTYSRCRSDREHLITRHLIDHTKTKGKLRNYDPLKQSFLFLPNDNPKRPIIVPQEYLILNDDPLLQEDIPQQIHDPLPPLQQIASQPLGDCEKSYFYAMTKKGYSNNELIFIISHLLSLLTNGNYKEKIHKEHKKSKQESPKKIKNDTPQPQHFRPTEELQKYTEILNIIKPYHHSNRDILTTIVEIVNALEQARSIIQNIVFDTTRISQSALCIRTSLDEFNYTIEKMHRS